MSIQSNPTITYQNNDPATPHMGTTEHLTWDHEDPHEGHVPHYQFILLHCNTDHGPHLDRHTLAYQTCMHSRDLGIKITNPTYRRGNNGRT